MSRILGISRVSSRHQIVLIKEVFELLNLKPGDKILFEQENGRVWIRKV